ncbi:MAG TPA: type I-MYXAN CRISPR-associated protein Cas6/Cmx6 [Pirellulales bacterium]|nr:type I-MYXAN CRISPR-associated protein Cas6/Cmx6 [Pirellulales bacterium]
MTIVELQFPVIGAAIPADHGYALYGALAHHLATLHADGNGLAIAPINGQYSGNNQFALNVRSSRLRFRLPDDRIASLLPLAGKALDVAGHKLRLGVPTVQALTPAPSLVARLVTIKGFKEPSPFLEAARRQLDALEIRGEIGIPRIAAGPHAGEPRRRILRIKDKKVVGFALRVTELTADESLRLQEHGIGGRRKMGCGFFVPLRARSP